jgi:predicted GNAT family N-acyltransferase
MANFVVDSRLHFARNCILASNNNLRSRHFSKPRPVSGNCKKKMAEITKSNIEDDEILTEITKKSKAYWGYSDEQMESWSDLLTITKNYIETNNVYKLLVDNLPIGYYSYIYLSEKEVKLDNLFVLPDYIGSGFGKLLMNDFLNRVKNSDRKKITLDSEPNAEKFYEYFGFIKVGQIETAIKDRYLPIMELKI